MSKDKGERVSLLSRDLFRTDPRVGPPMRVALDETRLNCPALYAYDPQSKHIAHRLEFDGSIGETGTVLACLEAAMGKHPRIHTPPENEWDEKRIQLYEAAHRLLRQVRKVFDDFDWGDIATSFDDPDGPFKGELPKPGSDPKDFEPKP